MRAATNRLEKVESTLSPKQMVLLHLEKGRRLGSLSAHAADLARNPEHTLCSLVEQSIRDSRRFPHPR
jgi:hypothetical protein